MAQNTEARVNHMAVPQIFLPFASSAFPSIIPFHKLIRNFGR